MNSEKEIIHNILKSMPVSSNHKNEFFHSDSEIIKVGAKDYLFTIDSFSNEDHFRQNNPYILGKNLATCTISDILASGGKLLFYGNSLAIPKDWDLNYINKLSYGIAEVIKKCNGFFAGGDLGTSVNWNYTGVAFGEAEKFITRKGSMTGDLIYITGPVGSGNFEAAIQMFNDNLILQQSIEQYVVEFRLRLIESQIIANSASACIDTSDGLFSGLQTLSDLNDVGFSIENIPYYYPGKVLTNFLKLPEELLMFGECGEYELLFTVHPELESLLLKEAKSNNVSFYKIGRISENNLRILFKNESEFDFTDFDMSARNYINHHLYLKDLNEYLNQKKLS